MLLCIIFLKLLLEVLHYSSKGEMITERKCSQVCLITRDNFIKASSFSYNLEKFTNIYEIPIFDKIEFGFSSELKN